MRVIVIIDGQNLYHLARRAWASVPQFPYAWPSYDVEKLASVLVARTHGRTLAETRFYTGVPDPSTGPSQMFWHGFWSNKIRYLRSLFNTFKDQDCQPTVNAVSPYERLAWNWPGYPQLFVLPSQHQTNCQLAQGEPQEFIPEAD